VAAVPVAIGGSGFSSKNNRETDRAEVMFDALALELTSSKNLSVRKLIAMAHNTTSEDKIAY
jgi:hypothetical protein